VEYVAPVNGLFGTYFATVKHEGKAINIVNVHLSPFVVQRGSNLPQAIAALTSVEVVHQKEIESILSSINSKNPTIVCGDFNSLSGFSAPTRLVESGLMDSFASVTDNADSHSTWQWPFGNSKIRFRIDYIFHSDHFRTVSSKIIPTKGSDHFLTVSEIEYKP
jgi:endonuclease/exonuclease/phosphatase family metal-dependent hydrolase